MVTTSTTDTLARRSVIERWRWDAALLAVSLVLPVLAYPGVARGLAGRWLAFDEAYSHGFFVLAISVWLAVRVLRQYRLPVAPSITGVLLALATSLTIALAQAIHVEIVQQVGIVFLAWALVFATIGWAAAGRLFFPIGFLAFAVPFWDYLAYPLQRITAAVSGLLLSVWDIRFSLEATFIRLEDIGVIEVANGCSGQRYLVIALTLAALYSYLNLRKKSWAVTLAVAAGLALLTNWVRVFGLVLIGYESVMTSPLLHEHELLGWLLFVLMLVPLIYLVNRLAAREEREDQRAGKPPAPQARGRAASRRGPAMLVIGLALVAVLLPAFATQRAGAPGDFPAALDFPAELGGWARRERGGPSFWRPLMRGADLTATATYGRAGTPSPVRLGVWLYRDQQPGEELIQYANHIVPQRWHTQASEALDVDGFSGRLLTLQSSNAGQRVVAAYGYRVAGYWTTTPLVAKGLQAFAVLAGDPRAGLVTVSADCGESCEAARAEVRGFLETAPQWPAFLPAP